MKRYGLRIWAEEGEVADPDLDTGHPIHEPTPIPDFYERGWRYVETPYTLSKQPHEWTNFLYNQADLKLMSIAEDGIAGWHVETEYQHKALATGSDDILYLSLIENVGVDPVGDLTETWEPAVAGGTAEEYEAKLTVLRDQMGAHNTFDNPHDTHCHDFYPLPSYDTTEIDGSLAGIIADLTAHLAVDNPHNTLAGIGNNMPDTLNRGDGGAFTGLVQYTQGTLHGTSSKVVGVDSGPNLRMAIAGVGHVGVSPSGLPICSVASVISEIFTGDTYTKLRNKAENKFALPSPEFDIPLVADLSTPSVGGGVITYDHPTDDPVFDTDGLVFDADTTLVTTTPHGAVGEYTAVVITDNGKFKVSGTNWSGSIHATVLLVDPIATRAKGFKVYFYLTPHQASML